MSGIGALAFVGFVAVGNLLLGLFIGRRFAHLGLKTATDVPREGGPTCPEPPPAVPAPQATPPASETVAEPEARESTESPCDEPADEPVDEGSSGDEPTAEEPTAEQEPIAEEPIAEEPGVAEEPGAEEPTAVDPVDQPPPEEAEQAASRMPTVATAEPEVAESAPSGEEPAVAELDDERAGGEEPAVVEPDDESLEAAEEPAATTLSSGLEDLAQQLSAIHRQGTQWLATLNSSDAATAEGLALVVQQMQQGSTGLQVAWERAVRQLQAPLEDCDGHQELALLLAEYGEHLSSLQEKLAEIELGDEESTALIFAGLRQEASDLLTANHDLHEQLGEPVVRAVRSVSGILEAANWCVDESARWFGRLRFESWLKRWQAESNSGLATAALFDVAHTRQWNDECGVAVVDERLDRVREWIEQKAGNNDRLFFISGQRFLVVEPGLPADQGNHEFESSRRELEQVANEPTANEQAANGQPPLEMAIRGGTTEFGAQVPGEALWSRLDTTLLHAKQQPGYGLYSERRGEISRIELESVEVVNN